MSIKLVEGRYYEDQNGAVYRCEQKIERYKEELPFRLTCVENKHAAQSTSVGVKYSYNSYGLWENKKVSPHNIVAEHVLSNLDLKQVQQAEILGMCLDMARKRLLPIEGFGMEQAYALAEECMKIIDQKSWQEIMEKLCR